MVHLPPEARHALRSRVFLTGVAPQAPGAAGAEVPGALSKRRGIRRGWVCSAPLPEVGKSFQSLGSSTPKQCRETTLCIWHT